MAAGNILDKLPLPTRDRYAIIGDQVYFLANPSTPPVTQSLEDWNEHKDNWKEVKL